MPRKAALTQPKAPRRAKATPPAPPPTPPAYTDTWLAVAALHLDARIQPRLGIDPQVVDAYTDLYREAAEGEEPLPPLDVFTIQGTYAVADGFHRLRAAHNAGLAQIHCHVYPGTLRDAMMHAAFANVQRGLPYTLGDKERVITRLLEDAEYAGQSDRKLARRLGVSNGYVSRLRRRLEARAHLEAQVCTVHTAPERLAALVQVPQETVERALQVSYDTPESLLDRMVRLIADEGMDEAAAIEQIASRFRVSTPPEPEAPWSPWPKRPSAAERREQRAQQQRADRANQLLWPLESFTEALETLVLPLEVLQADDPDYQRDADDPTLEELMDAVASDPREGLATMTAFLARARAILAAIEQAVAAYQQQHGAA